ncbi:hypothetical protein [Nonomuraea endophytica]|uniref:Uncharacterized protein n=1 Tax=Nonomuraea endophytica TaxID=714136 RepID=A0A7W8EDK3_9ACTN|nr:hypothetical protein [Nonomuraea endophytica]MBB5075371.1 hypothetical protein [Nonomuraea endophytica]
MTFTEDDLRALLDERTAPAPERATDVTQIVRRGRRMLMIRWGMGAALAGAAALVAFLVVPGQSPNADPIPVAAATPSATPSRTPERQPALTLDGKDRSAALASDKSAVGYDLKLTPKSSDLVVRCEEPGAWVALSFKGGAQKGATARCAGRGTRFELSGKAKSVRVWVFPANAPVVDRPLKDCVLVEKEKGLCDGKYAAAELIRYDVALSLAADLGAQPGSWSAAVYDRP